MKKLIAASLLALIVSGCAQQSFTLKKEITYEPKNVTTHNFFIGGVGQSREIDAAEICGSAGKVVRTEVQQTFIDGLLGFITFGIYTPREARVYCGKTN